MRSAYGRCASMSVITGNVYGVPLSKTASLTCQLTVARALLFCSCALSWIMTEMSSSQSNDCDWSYILKQARKLVIPRTVYGVPYRQDRHIGPLLVSAVGSRNAILILK